MKPPTPFLSFLDRDTCFRVQRQFETLPIPPSARRISARRKTSARQLQAVQLAYIFLACALVEESFVSQQRRVCDRLECRAETFKAVVLLGEGGSLKKLQPLKLAVIF